MSNRSNASRISCFCSSVSSGFPLVEAFVVDLEAVGTVVVLRVAIWYFDLIVSCGVLCAIKGEKGGKEGMFF